MPIQDTKVGTRTPRDVARTPRDGTGNGQPRTANIPSASRHAMSLPAIRIEPPAGAKTPKGIPIEKRREEVAAAIARAFASAYCQHANPEEIMRKDAELKEEGAYIREVEIELAGIAHSNLKDMSGHKIQMIGRGFSEVEEFITKMGAALAESIKLRRTGREISKAKQRHTGRTEVYAMDPFAAIGKAFQLIAELSVNPQKFAENLEKVVGKVGKTAQNQGPTEAAQFCMGKELESMLQ